MVGGDCMCGCGQNRWCSGECVCNWSLHLFIWTVRSFWLDFSLWYRTRTLQHDHNSASCDLSWGKKSSLTFLSSGCQISPSWHLKKRTNGHFYYIFPLFLRLKLTSGKATWLVSVGDSSVISPSSRITFIHLWSKTENLKRRKSPGVDFSSVEYY